MFSNKFKPLLIAFTLAGCVGGFQLIANAQGTPGLVIFGDRDVDILNYYLDFGGTADARDRYRLRIPKKKLENGLKSFGQFLKEYKEKQDGK